MFPSQLFNWFEAGFWIILGLLVLVIGTRRARTGRATASRMYLVAAPTLVLFGISDIIEVHTGAWWSPWWLLLLKGACLAALGGCGVVLLRHARGR